jgi:hypothetical protein
MRIVHPVNWMFLITDADAGSIGYMVGAASVGVL